MKRASEGEFSFPDVNSSGEAIERAGAVAEEAGRAGRTARAVLDRAREALGDGHEQAYEGEADVDDLPEGVSSLLREDRLLQWLHWHRLLRDLDRGAREALDRDDSPRVALHFRRVGQVCDRLGGSGCANLSRHARAFASSLRSLAAVRLAGRLEGDLEKLNYPHCILSEQVPVGKLNYDAVSAVASFRTHFLLMVQLFGGKYKEEEAEEEDGGDEAAPAAVEASPGEIMLAPLRKRFRYHFSGSRKTNNPVRPEWFLMQTKLWLRNCGRFFERCGLVEGGGGGVGVAGQQQQRLARREVLAEVRLVRQGLLRMAADKLAEDLESPYLRQDDLLLSHAIDEVLIFTKDAVVVEMSSGVESEALPVSVLSRDEVCQRWLTLERKYAFEKMDALLLEEDGWLSSAASPDLLRCADAFVTLLQSLVARFKPVREAHIKLRFVSLLFDLLEDFRMRLVKVMRGEQEKGGGEGGRRRGGGVVNSEVFALALNSAMHLADTLESWQEMPLFLHLTHLRRQAASAVAADSLTGSPSSSSSGLLFAPIVDSFNFVVKDSTDYAAELILYEVKAQSLRYRRSVSWSEPCEEEALRPQDEPSLEALGMFQSLSANLTSFCQRLRPSLIAQVTQRVSWLLSEFLLEEVVLVHDFSPAGARRLSRDVKAGIEPILAQVGSATSVSATSLKASRLSEATSLLCSPAGNAMLLLEALEEEVAIDQAKDILREHGISRLSGTMAKAVLMRRTDVAEMKRAL